MEEKKNRKTKRANIFWIYINLKDKIKNSYLLEIEKAFINKEIKKFLKQTKTRKRKVDWTKKPFQNFS